MAKVVEFDIKLNSNGEAVMGRLTMSAKQLSRAIEATQNRISKSFDSVVSSMAAMTFAFENCAKGIEQLATPTMSFDQAMRAANTMASKSADDFERLKDEVKGLSKEIPIARELLANGLYQTISNGVSENNWISFLEASARSSIGGMANLEEVVKVTSTVIKNYGYSWEDAAAIQDKIQLTAKNGVTSFEQLAQALPKVTGNAATLGVQIDELMATFSTLTGVSGNTAEVSTQLAAIFTALIKPSSQAQKMAKAMGIEFNAASIKAAGGLRNFLTGLDEAVKRYAEANGVLEEAVYGKLFGSAESLRAVAPLVGQLSETFEENIAAMADSAGTMDAAFEEMSNSSEARMQRVKNTIASIIDPIGKLAARTLPAIQYTASLGMALGGLRAIGKTVAAVFSNLAGVFTRLNLVQRVNIALNKASMAILSIMPRRIKAYALSLTMLATTSRGAAIAVYVLKGAIKSLIAATGIGLLFTGISAVMGLFSKKTDEAAEAAAEAKKEFEDWKKSLTDLSGLTEQETAKEMLALDRLYRAATDETKSRRERLKAANELKNTYKDTFAILTTEAILAGKAADAYERQKNAIVQLATAKAAESKILENRGQWIDLDAQRTDLEQELESKKKVLAEIYAALENEMERKSKKAAETPAQPSIDQLARNEIKLPTDAIVAPTVDMELELAESAKAVRQEIGMINSQLSEIGQKQAVLDDARTKLEKYIETDSTTTTNGSNNLDDLLNESQKNATVRQKLEKQMAEAKERYIKASIAGNEAEMASSKAVIDSLRQQIEQIESYEAIAERPASLATLKDINAEIKYQQKLRETASKEDIAAIDAEIERLEEQKKVMESSKVKPIDQIKTYEELDATRQHYQNKMQKATEEERVEIQKVIDLLDELRQSWDEALTQAPGEIPTLDTLKKLSDAISYYENKMQNATASEIAGYQKTLALLRQKQTLMQRSGTIIEAQQQVDSVNSAQGMDWYVKVNAIGFDTLSDKIREIQALLNDTKNPLSDDMRIQAEGVVEEYKRMRVASLASNQGLQKVWGTTKGVAGGLQSMKSALTESDDAWSKVAGTIDSAIQIYESVRQVIDILSAITAVLTIRKKAEKVATDENTVSTVEGAAAKVAASVAEQAASTANTTAQVQEAAAKTMSAHASIPWVGIAIGGAMIAAMLATMFALPKFADGGIAYGPTVGLFGEYPGASNNPEVVAPLNKLRALIQPAGLDPSKVVFEIEGTKLKGVMKNVERRSSRV